MYNDNYWLMRAYAEKNVVPQSYAELSLGIKDKSGNTVSIYVVNNTASPQYSSVWNPAVASRLCVGAGDTAADISDYSLEDDVTGDFSGVSYTVNAAGNDGVEVVYTISGTNNTGADIVIKEIGIETQCADTSYHAFYILTAREVLDTPYTVEAGKGFILTVKAKTK